jgi:hypothetical protein
VSKEDRKFYVTITEKEDSESYSVSLGEPKESSTPEEAIVKPKQVLGESGFIGVFHDFINVMDMYMKFIPLIISAGQLSYPQQQLDGLRNLPLFTGRREMTSQAKL